MQRAADATLSAWHQYKAMPFDVKATLIRAAQPRLARFRDDDPLMGRAK
jgi:hypothetical protein